MTLDHYPFELKIVNMNGTLVDSIDIKHSHQSETNIDIDLKDYPSGLYQLIFQTIDEVYQRKFIVIGIYSYIMLSACKDSQLDLLCPLINRCLSSF